MCAAIGLCAAGLAGCDGPLSPNVAAVDNIPTPDFAARGPVPRGRYGDLTATPARGAEVFKGSAAAAPLPLPAVPASAAVTAAEAAAPGDAVASIDGVVPAGNGFQLNFESADVGAVAKAILGDILHANYLVDKRVAGQLTLTSSQPIARARLVPLLETALAGLGATVIKDQDMYRVVPAADPGGIGAVTGRDVGEGYGTSVITARYMPAANLGKLLEGFGSRPGSVKTDPGTNLVIITGTATERRAAIEAAGTVDVDWLRTKSVAILPVANSSPETVISELNHIMDTGEGGLAQGAVQLQPMTRANAVLAVARTGSGIDLVRRWVARLDRADAGGGSVKVYKLQYAQAKAVASALNDLFGSGGGSGQSDPKDPLEPSGYGSVTSQAPPTASGVGAGGGGLGTGATLGGGGGADAANGGAGSPFGVLKAAMASGGGGGGAAKASMADTEALRGGGAGGGGAKVRVTADPNSNSLLINASASEYRAVERAIRQMDRAPVQVDIEATIAEVTLTDALQYGLQFFLQGSRSLGLSGAQNLQVSNLNTAGLNLLAGGLSSPRVLVSALQGYTTVKILSSPSLVVLDRQPAVLQVGDQVPILTRTAQSVENTQAPVVNNVDYKDTGIILNVLPKVNADGVVTLDIEQQISAVVNSDPTNPNLTPTISQRRVRSSVAVQNGQTVMLAGLILDKRNNDRSGIPGLGSITLINDLLTNHDSAVNRTEIVIFIRPQIITNAADAQQVTEEFHDRLLSMQRAPEKPIVRRY